MQRHGDRIPERLGGHDRSEPFDAATGKQPVTVLPINQPPVMTGPCARV
jgi:hypothetical protein